MQITTKSLFVKLIDNQFVETREKNENLQITEIHKPEKKSLRKYLRNMFFYS